MSELKRQLEEKLGLTKANYIDIKNLPPQVKAKIVKANFKPDKYGNQCLYLTLETLDKKLIIQKFTESTWQTLYEIFSKFGFENLENNYHFWKLQRIGKSQQPRLLPSQA